MKTQLPEEIIALDILARLPAKSLMRFKCVSKSWYALFQNPNFINAHRVFHNDDAHLMVNGVKRGEEVMFSIFSDETPEPKSYFDLPFPVENDEDGMYYDVHLVSSRSINGIICLVPDFSTVIIMNPATRESKVTRRSNPKSEKFLHIEYGFGYDPITDDYKFVRLVCSFAIKSYLTNQFVEVYSLRSDCWRKLDAAMNWCMSGPTSCSVFVNGMIHWTALERNLDDTQILLSFDISTELFYTTVLPYQERANQVARMKESIAVMSYRRLELGLCWDVWILGEVGVKDSWTKHLTVGPFLDIVEPIGTGKNDEIFFLKQLHFEDDEMELESRQQELEVACYNPNTQMLRDLGLRMLRYQITSTVAIYSESIVLLQRNN